MDATEAIADFLQKVIKDVNKQAGVDHGLTLAVLADILADCHNPHHNDIRCRLSITLDCRGGDSLSLFLDEKSYKEAERYIVILTETCFREISRNAPAYASLGFAAMQKFVGGRHQVLQSLPTSCVFEKAWASAATQGASAWASNSDPFHYECDLPETGDLRNEAPETQRNGQEDITKSGDETESLSSDASLDTQAIDPAAIAGDSPSSTNTPSDEYLPEMVSRTGVELSRSPSPREFVGQPAAPTIFATPDLEAQVTEDGGGYKQGGERDVTSDISGTVAATTPAGDLAGNSNDNQGTEKAVVSHDLSLGPNALFAPIVSERATPKDTIPLPVLPATSLGFFESVSTPQAPSLSMHPAKAPDEPSGLDVSLRQGDPGAGAVSSMLPESDTPFACDILPVGRATKFPDDEFERDIQDVYFSDTSSIASSVSTNDLLTPSDGFVTPFASVTNAQLTPGGGDLRIFINPVVGPAAVPGGGDLGLGVQPNAKLVTKVSAKRSPITKRALTPQASSSAIFRVVSPSASADIEGWVDLEGPDEDIFNDESDGVYPDE